MDKIKRKSINFFLMYVLIFGVRIIFLVPAIAFHSIPAWAIFRKYFFDSQLFFQCSTFLASDTPERFISIFLWQQA